VNPKVLCRLWRVYGGMAPMYRSCTLGAHPSEVVMMYAESPPTIPSSPSSFPCLAAAFGDEEGVLEASLVGERLEFVKRDGVTKWDIRVY
jgi:hypothetical protein